MTETADAFDEAATRYDADAAVNPMMRWLRCESMRSLVRTFKPGDFVLEIGCGTGEEALALARRRVHVLATDASAGMVEVVRRKIGEQRLDESLIRVETLPAERLSLLLDEYGPGSFDGAYSSLGPLNCTADLRPVAGALAGLIKPDGRLVISMLNKYCLWEALWYLVAREPSLAVRRWKGHAPGTALPGGPLMNVHYWSVGAIEGAFNQYFRIRQRQALPWALPPTYAAGFLKQRPFVLALLDGVERRTAHLWPFYTLGDHIHLELARRRNRLARS